MAFAHGKNARALFEDLTLHAYLRDTRVDGRLELADVTVYGDTGHKFVPGLWADAMTFGGLFDTTATAGGQDETLDTALGAATGSAVSVAPAGFAVGSRVFAATARETRYAIGSQVSDAVSFDVQVTADGLVDLGHSLHDLTAETATGNGTTHDGTASTASGGAGTLHVTAASGTSPTLAVKIQHSTNNSTWTDLITFTTATATTSQRSTVTGTVNRYLRAIWTITGTTPSFTFHVNFARR